MSTSNAKLQQYWPDDETSVRLVPVGPPPERIQPVEPSSERVLPEVRLVPKPISGTFEDKLQKAIDESIKENQRMVDQEELENENLKAVMERSIKDEPSQEPNLEEPVSEEPVAEEQVLEGVDLMRMGSNSRIIQDRINELEMEKKNYLVMLEFDERANEEIASIEQTIQSMKDELAKMVLPDELIMGNPLSDKTDISGLSEENLHYALLQKYYKTTNFCIYDMQFITSIDSTNEKRGILQIKDIRPTDPKKFCNEFTHLKDMTLTPPHEKYLREESLENLRIKHSEVINSANVVFVKYNKLIKPPFHDKLDLSELKKIAAGVLDVDIPKVQELIDTSFRHGYENSEKGKKNMLLDYIINYSKYTTEKRIKDDLRSFFYEKEIDHMIRKTWLRTSFADAGSGRSSALQFVSSSIFTKMQNDLGYIPDNSLYTIYLKYESKIYSYNDSEYIGKVNYDEILTRFFNVESLPDTDWEQIPFKSKLTHRVIINLHLPLHNCLLISQNFGGIKKIVFYNPNSSRLRGVEDFIKKKYLEITGKTWDEESSPFQYISSDKISNTKYSIQGGPSCVLYSQKLWLLCILNPSIDIEKLINYAFHQTNSLMKQHILTFYSTIYFIELFLEKIVNLQAMIDILSENLPDKFILPIFYYNIEIYYISNKYLHLNGCPNFNLNSEILEKVISIIKKHGGPSAILAEYYRDPNYRVLPLEMRLPKKLVPDEFQVEIPDSPQFASKKKKSKKKKSKKESKKKQSKKKQSKKESKKKQSKKESKKKSKNYTKKTKKPKKKSKSK
jgi:hypothetical protein